MKPLFGGFFRIAPLTQTDDDGGFFRIALLVHRYRDGVFMERAVWRKQKQRRAMHAAVCNIDVKKLVFEVDNKVELVELLLVERSRSVEHNVATAVVFRERDAVAD